MDDFVLFRGISVADEDGDDIIAAIHRVGVRGDEGRWQFRGMNLRPHLDRILKHPSLKGLDDGGDELVVCACGHEDGARFYAVNHNHKPGNRPLVVKFLAPVAAPQVPKRPTPRWIASQTAADASLRRVDIARHGDARPTAVRRAQRLMRLPVTST